MRLDPRSVAAGYRIAKMQMLAELADVRAGIEAELAALKSELAAAKDELYATRARLENLKRLHVVEEATKLELARRRTLIEAAAAQRDENTPLQRPSRLSVLQRILSKARVLFNARPAATLKAFDPML
jgi:hypothetical protein